MQSLNRYDDFSQRYFYDRGNCMNNFLNRQAFFADGTPFYRLYTADGAEAAGYSVRLRFRTAKDNAASVMVVTDCVRANMHKSFSERNFDYLETVLHYP